ncbi:MAG TPA: recombination mediator RecR [Candidatus Cloacimonadota bacterium]|nr:recombination mediator RecR [Candidatus Cloacimonadota bacterium]
MFNGLLKDLAQNLKQFPGVGEKTAQRLAMFLISQDKEKSRRLAQSILDAVDKYNHCSKCNMLAETDPCPFCSDTDRDVKRICVVENTADVYLINNTHEFRGIYFVLGHLLSPLDGIGPAEINFPMLVDKIGEHQPEEVILALNPSPEGETTINYIASQLQPMKISITRLSTGLPFGGDIEYTSSMTLSHAFKRRMPI